MDGLLYFIRGSAPLHAICIHKSEAEEFPWLAGLIVHLAIVKNEKAQRIATRSCFIKIDYDTVCTWKLF